MNDRIRKPYLAKYLISAEEACSHIKSGMTVAMSGWAMAGYPKAVVEELVVRKKKEEDLSVNLITGANVPWLDEKLGPENLISRRAPMIADRSLANQANAGTVSYVEQQMNKMPKLLRAGSLGKIDIAVIEAVGFTENGDLIPSSSIGLSSYLMDAADKIIVEVNSAQPEILEKLHDIHILAGPPHTQPIPIVKTAQRIGKSSISLDPGKICGIVQTNLPERLEEKNSISEEAVRIAGHLFNFLEMQVQKDGELPPIQTGFGTIANAIAAAFQKSAFRNLQFFCGGITESVMELLASGKASALSTGGLGMSQRVEEILHSFPDIRKHLVIRNGDVTNSPEVINRLGLLALNTGIEMDIYGNVNSSHISGTRVVNGIGGGAGFAQNAGLSIVLMPSSARGGDISSIVPMVSHLDISEHDVDIVITENGLADLRGRDDHERAETILNNCVSDLYRAQLRAYLQRARKLGGHHPQLPGEAFDWYRRLKEEGTMREKEL